MCGAGAGTVIFTSGFNYNLTVSATLPEIVSVPVPYYCKYTCKFFVVMLDVVGALFPIGVLLMTWHWSSRGQVGTGTGS